MQSNKILTGILLSLLICSSLSVVQAATPTWSFTTVEPSRGFLFQPGIINLGSDNRPRIAYCDYASFDPRTSGIVYATFTGSSWLKDFVAIGGLADFALDSRDNPYIIYQDATGDNYGLICANWNGSQWNKQTVDRLGLEDASLAIDSTDKPHIVYALNDLKYATLNESNWGIQTLTTTGNNSGVFLALDKHDNPHILYREGDYFRDTQTSIKYAVWNSKEGWTYQTVFENLPQNSSFAVYDFALDSKDNPHFTYSEQKWLNDTHYTTMLMYESWNGTGWESQLVDSPTDAGAYFALDRYDQPHIIYFKLVSGLTAFGGNLYHAKWAGDKWDIQKIIKNPDASGGGTIKMAYDGTIHIAFVGRESYSSGWVTDVNYATATEPLSTPSPIPSPTPTPVLPDMPSLVTSALVAVVIVGVAGAFVYVFRKRRANKR